MDAMARRAAVSYRKGALVMKTETGRSAELLRSRYASKHWIAGTVRDFRRIGCHVIAACANRDPGLVAQSAEVRDKQSAILQKMRTAPQAASRILLQLRSQANLSDAEPFHSKSFSIDEERSISSNRASFSSSMNSPLSACSRPFFIAARKLSYLLLRQSVRAGPLVQQ